MNRAPNIWTVNRLKKWVDNSEVQRQQPNGQWVPARPYGFYSFKSRFRAAWLVFTGKADALTWDGDQ
jgi:hypothetical protein